MEWKLSFFFCVSLCVFVHTGCLSISGMLHAGIGASHVNMFLTTMNIPCPTRTTSKKREREVGMILETAAKRSCTIALRNECARARTSPIIVDGACGETMVDAQLENRNEASQEFERGNQEASSKNVDIGISYDCAWQRRGGGKAYNSMTGVGHAFGVTTKKIVGFGV